MSTTTTLTPQQRLAVIRHLADGKSADVVATIMRTTKDDVVALAKHHGYPDTDKLAWAADILAEKLDDDARGAIPDGMSDRAAALSTATPTKVERAVRVVEQTQHAIRETSPAQADDVLATVNAAKAHPSKRIVNAANKVLDDLARLRQLLADDEQKNAARRKATAEKAAAKAEVERLQQQLREAKAKLGGKPAAATKRSTAPKGDYPCRNDGCDKHYDTPQGRSLHERMRCSHREEAAS